MTNLFLDSWVRESAALCKPDAVHWCDGSPHEYSSLCDVLVRNKTAVRLNQTSNPNSLLCRSDPRDVARVEDRTFICSLREDDAGPTNNWRDPDETRAAMRLLYDGSMSGRVMYVIPFCMGPMASPLARFGVEISDSPYVACHMTLVTRIGASVLAALGEGDFVRGLHSVGAPLQANAVDVPWPCDPERTIIAHFPAERAIWSYGSGYGGNALLGKKCFALRLASCMAHDDWTRNSAAPNAIAPNATAPNATEVDSVVVARETDDAAKRASTSLPGAASSSTVVLAHEYSCGGAGGWMAEHMLILGLTNPQGRKKYFAAAFPSACGKTNLAMMKPTLPGWKVECVGDDIAWMQWDKAGKLRAINPEAGFFGVAPGTSEQSNPNAMATLARDTIFTNVAQTPEGGVWWEGLSAPPSHLASWRGEAWTPRTGTPASHPNARFACRADNCPVIDPDWESPQGVAIEAILFGGRRAATVPLVYQSFDWRHGVFLGSVVASETTAAASGATGVVRRDPFAMLPFCGYNMGDYFNHWLRMGEQNQGEHQTASWKQVPLIFAVNWFRKDEEGRFLWPGYGENSRVLKWIFERVDEASHADENNIFQTDSSTVRTPLGWMPALDALDLSGLSIGAAQMQELLKVDGAAWLREAGGIRDYYALLGERLPAELKRQRDDLEARLKASFAP